MIIFLRHILSGLSWLCIFILLFWAFHLKNPHLLSIRNYETGLLLGLCVICFIFFLRKNRSIERTAGLCLLGVISIITLKNEFFYHYRKVTVLNEDLDIERKLSQHFVIGYGKMEDLRQLISKGIVGGVYITQRNALGKTAEQLRQEIDEMQQLRKKVGLAKLIITTDQEGGIVSRLSPPLELRPALASLLAGARNKAELLDQAEAFGVEQGKELASLGVTVNFSPVVDLQSNTGQSMLDFHSHINQRAISSHSELTTSVALAYARGLEKQGVGPTLKHFPGLGSVEMDTHHFSVALDTPVEDLAARDWLPFRLVSAQSNSLIMLSHVILSQIDKENPVSFSRTVVQKIIRDTWKHEGLLITDDLTMAAAYNYGLCAATVKSLNAGVDLLLISYDYEKYYEAMYCAVAAYKEGALVEDQLDRSNSRLEESRRR